MQRSVDLSLLLRRSRMADAPPNLSERVVAEVDARLARLSGDQAETERMICAGLFNKEIARKMDVSTRTVEVRRSQILRAFGAANAAQLGFTVGAAEAFRWVIGQPNGTRR